MTQALILIVEDNEQNMKLVRDVLGHVGYRTLEAGDAELGIELARTHRPDLILMDVQLPKLSGLDATRMLRADERTRHIPVLVITSFAMSGDCERATEAGADGYLAKPYSPKELLALVHRFLPEEP
jgi:two-component system, cell cycle response regulator DivK